MYYYLLLSSKNNIWKMTVSLLTANNITSTVYEWLGYFISPYWWHTQLKHFWSKNHTAIILNYLTLTRKIQREWTLQWNSVRTNPAYNERSDITNRIESPVWKSYIILTNLFGYNEPCLQRTLAFNVQYLGAKAVYNSVITYARALLLHSRKQ
jgi:hypothetical protein